MVFENSCAMKYLESNILSQSPVTHIVKTNLTD